MYWMIRRLAILMTLMGSTAYPHVLTRDFARPEVPNRDKAGASAAPRMNDGPQPLTNQQVASRCILAAEGTGLEPATPNGAPHFECGC